MKAIGLLFVTVSAVMRARLVAAFSHEHGDCPDDTAFLTLPALTACGITNPMSLVPAMSDPSQMVDIVCAGAPAATCPAELNDFAATMRACTCAEGTAICGIVQGIVTGAFATSTCDSIRGDLVGAGCNAGALDTCGEEESEESPTKFPTTSFPTKFPTTKFPTAAGSSGSSGVGIIPDCADNGNTAPCVPALDGSAACPAVELTVANQFATEVLKSCGIANSASELTVVGGFTGDVAKDKFFEILCGNAASPAVAPEPEACAANLASMGLVFHGCDCGGQVICQFIAQPLYNMLQPLEAACDDGEGGDLTSATCRANSCASVAGDFVAHGAYCGGTTYTCPGGAPPPAPGPSSTKYPATSSTKYPTKFPATSPTKYPTKFPATSPTKYPTTGFPTKWPVEGPTREPTSRYPTTKAPTRFPSRPTRKPTSRPTRAPTAYPTQPPTPTRAPTKFPTGFPSTYPSGFPSTPPTKFPPVILIYLQQHFPAPAYVFFSG